MKFPRGMIYNTSGLPLVLQTLILHAIKVMYGETSTKDKHIIKIINRSILYITRAYKGSTLANKTVFQLLSEVKTSILKNPIDQEKIIPEKVKKQREKKRLKRLKYKCQKKMSSNEKKTSISTDLKHQNEQSSTVQPLKKNIVPYKDIARCSTSPEVTTVYLTSSPMNPNLPDTTAEKESSNIGTFQPNIKIECQNVSPQQDLINSFIDSLSNSDL